jgi:hypothetical protein
MRRQLAGLLAALLLLPALGRAEETDAQGWSGLIHKSSVDKLKGRVDKKFNGAPYSVAVIQSADDLKAFLDTVEARERQKNPVWTTWRKADFSKEVVVCVVLTTPTNKLSMKGWTAPKEGTGTLSISWSGIEPFYGEFYPAVLVRVPVKDLKKINVQVDGKPLAELPVAVKKGMRQTGRAVFLVFAQKNPEGEQKKPAVRKLETPKNLPFATDDPGVKTFESLEALKKALGEQIGATLGKGVDFAKEQVVQVRYNTSGPPFGTLEFEVDEKKKAVEFYVKEPKVNVRGQALKLGREFFVVPRGWAVKKGADR